MNENISIRPANIGDAQHLRPILQEWIRDPESGTPLTDEIEGVVSAVESSIGHPEKPHFLVAEDAAGSILGMMGIAEPSQDMQGFAETDRPAEIVNAYVTATSRGSGIGTKLLDAAEEEAKKTGHSEVIVNSGPRYKDTAWAFYDKRFGGRVTTLKDKYGPGRDAPIWRRKL